MRGGFVIECSINNITKYYSANKVFENISFEVYTRDRIGLIGQNGCGKTTLLKILMSMEEYQDGNLSFRKGIKIGYLDQIFKCDNRTTVLDILQSPFEEIRLLRNKMKELEKELKNLSGDILENQMENYGLMIEEFERSGGYLVETNINKICTGLNIPDSFRGLPFERLSGGEKTRVLLAKLLLEEPDLLLLDEPTNHLDIKSIEWLEEFLKEYKGTVLMVSHDRSFLDKVTTRIIEMEPTEVNIYEGNYSFYLIEKEKRFELAYRAYLNKQRKIESMERQIERYRIWGAMRDSEKMYKRAKELEKRLDKVEVIDKPKDDTAKIKLNTSGIQRSGKIVLDIEDLSKSFADKNLFSNLSFTLFYKDRLCIMGDNGSGKTTLLKLILGEDEKYQGKIKYGSNISIGYLPQNVVFEDEDLTILDYFAAKHKLSNSDARKELAKMLFIRDDVFKKITSLSGGEKSRLRLASLIYDKVNFLILDEPTNHLDIDSREVLEDTLFDYNGTILFVSHDRYFIEKLANKMLIFENSKVDLYPMPYKEYLELRQRLNIESPIEKPKKEPKAPQKKVERKPNNTYKINALNREIEKLEEDLDRLSLEMEANNDDADKLYQLYIEKENLESKLLESYEELEMLQ
ncbi:ABC-F type ribosomal protection protein [Tissierella creatinini]|nr:ABC-F type ribosomal protection protein [Tissierella creatinini]TJX60560.1 ABC-F type ribosomal protection protein [Soehngenia saccharolytica]